MWGHWNRLACLWSVWCRRMFVSLLCIDKRPMMSKSEHCPRGSDDETLPPFADGLRAVVSYFPVMLHCPLTQTWCLDIPKCFPEVSGRYRGQSPQMSLSMCQCRMSVWQFFRCDIVDAIHVTMQLCRFNIYSTALLFLASFEALFLHSCSSGSTLLHPFRAVVQKIRCLLCSLAACFTSALL